MAYGILLRRRFLVMVGISEVVVFFYMLNQYIYSSSTTCSSSSASILVSLPPGANPSRGGTHNIEQNVTISILGDSLHVGKNLFVNYNVNAPGKVSLMDEKPTDYFINREGHRCFEEGTFSVDKMKGCICHEDYFGKWCSFPVGLKGAPFDLNKVVPRDRPRRIIYGTPFSIEFEMFEARMAELGEIVELFMVSESIYSGHGDRKPLRLLEKLREGYVSSMHKKIFYVYIDYFPKGAYSNGWLADNLPRDALGVALKKNVVNVRHDDLYILTDTDELPTRQAVLFFKLHDGYPEPFGFLLHTRTFGFFWHSTRCPISAGGTIGMVTHVLEHKVIKLRNPAGHLPKLGVQLKMYMKTGANVKPWIMGNEGNNYVGWHCSWCTKPEGIRIKLISAINADFPRWGDYPEKCKIPYIQALVKRGMWFDDKSTMKRCSVNSPMYAPLYILQHWRKFEYILVNPYLKSGSI